MPEAAFAFMPAAAPAASDLATFARQIGWTAPPQPPPDSDRVVVTWEGDFSNVAVMLKGVELGRVKDQQALLRGANFRLPDRANLRVQLLKKPVGKILTVARNGHRLPAIAGPEAPIKTGADQLFLLAILNFVPGVMMLLARERDLFGMGAGLVATGLLLGALGLWGTRRFAAPFWIG